MGAHDTCSSNEIPSFREDEVKESNLTGAYFTCVFRGVIKVNIVAWFLQSGLVEEAALAGDSVPDMDASIVLFIMVHRCTDTSKPRKCIQSVLK